MDLFISTKKKIAKRLFLIILIICVLLGIRFCSKKFEEVFYHKFDYQSGELTQLRDRIKEEYSIKVKINSYFYPATLFIKIRGNIESEKMVYDLFEIVKDTVTEQHFLDDVLNKYNECYHYSESLNFPAITVRFDINYDKKDDYSFDASYYVETWDSSKDPESYTVDKYSSWSVFKY